MARDNFNQIEYSTREIESKKTVGIASTFADTFKFGSIVFSGWSLLRIVFMLLIVIYLFRLLNYSHLPSVSFTDLLQWMANENWQGNVAWLTEDISIWRIPLELANTGFGQSLINVANFILSPITAILFICQRLIFVLQMILSILGFVILGI